jgi:DNA-binding MarR family transcriptional regulator
MEEPSNKKELQTLSRINSVYAVGLTEGVSVALIQTFLVVARHEGKTVNEIAELAKASRVTVSRHLLDLSIELRNGKPGYGVLDRIQHPSDLRSVVYTLTTKGKKLVGQLMEALEN